MLIYNTGKCCINILNKVIPHFQPVLRHLNCAGESNELTGLVLGVFSRDDDVSNSQYSLTKAAQEFNTSVNGSLSFQLERSGPIPKFGEYKIFYQMGNYYTAVAVTGLGDECKSYNDYEHLDENKEAIRNATAIGARALQNQHMRYIDIESMGHAESSAEGAAMGIWVYQELKTNRKFIPTLNLHNDCDFTGWQIGLQKAAAQNLARQLTETPANVLTPIAFAQAAVELLTRAGISVEVKVRDWARIMELNAFLAASKGSCEPPVFLECSYYGCDPDIAPIVLIGKGTTFDSGGLCLHSVSVQKDMRGDMSGAATVVAVIRAAAALQLPINIRGLIPLYENLPGACALKSGDIMRTKNGKTVLVNNSVCAGRLPIADAMTYAGTYNPKFIASVGGFSKELIDAFGEGAIAAYCNNDSLFDMMRIAGIHTGDRVWRMPLWHHFTEKITATPFADVHDKCENTALVERMTDNGIPSQAAAFFYEFIPKTDWIHLDTYNVLTTDGKAQRYLCPGMSGRPTRTVIEFLAQLACSRESGDGSAEAEEKEKMLCSI